MEKLSGRGGRLDSPQCRQMMYHVMKKYPPEVFQTYINGRLSDNTPYFHNDHLTNAPRPRYADPRPHIIDRGGSLTAITHSENGFLQAHDSTFHHTFQEV